MNIKHLMLLLCLILSALLFAGCDKGEDTPCAHTYSNGVCTLCGEPDPDYKPEGEKPEDKPSGEKPEDKPDGEEKDPAEFGTETELPFVPAK